MKNIKAKMMVLSVSVAQALALNFADVYQQNGTTGPVVCVRPGGGYLLAMGEVSTGYPLTLVWTDTTGVIQQAYGYRNLGAPVEVMPTSDGGYVVIGNATAGKYVLKVNSSGVVQWARAHSGLYDITSVTETSAGDILVGGRAYPNSRTRPALWKINGSTGATLWDRYYFNQGTTSDAFALKGVCDFSRAGSYYAVITRLKPIGMNFYLSPALLAVNPSDGSAQITYLENAIDSTLTTTLPMGCLMEASGRSMWVSWGVSGWNARRYSLHFDGGTGPVSVPYLYGNSYPLAGGLPIKASPDTSDFYLVSYPRVIKMDRDGTPLWAVDMSGYSGGGNFSVAQNGDPVLTYLSSGYTYPVMLARLESSDGSVCISAPASLPNSSTASGTLSSFGALTSYDLGTPTNISVSRTSVSPGTDVVCQSVYDKENEYYSLSGTDMITWMRRGGLEVELSLSAGIDVSLLVFDAAGRLHASLWNGSLGSGQHHFSVETMPGVYVVILRTSGVCLTKTVAVSP